MPIAPQFYWEQSLSYVTIRAYIKGFKESAIDVFISDLLIKVNATPTYLLLLDLLHPIVVEESVFRIDAADFPTEATGKTDALAIDLLRESTTGLISVGETDLISSKCSSDGLVVKIVLLKKGIGIWDTLVIDKKLFASKKKKNRLLPEAETEIQEDEKQSTTKGNENAERHPDIEDIRVDQLIMENGEDGKNEKALQEKEKYQTIFERRQAAIARAEKLYSTKLESREQQKAVEHKRLFNEQWEIEKRQREEIIAKVNKEKEDERSHLYNWEEEERNQLQHINKKLKSPADIAFLHKNEHINKININSTAGGIPSVRSVETTNIPINFTPKSLTVPTRTRGDEEYYRKSRYKPVSIEDSPMFWKEKADKFYRQRNFRLAAESYTESIKRDGCFLSCFSNRAACYIQLHQYKKAIEDCDLGLTLLANTPASETTQEKYKRMMTKLHTRRGAAKCWDGQYSTGLEDFQMAVAYRNGEEDTDVVADLNTVENFMRRNGLKNEADPKQHLVCNASHLYYNGNYAGACEIYRQLLALDEFDIKSRSNLTAALLQQGLFKEVLEEAQHIMSLCAEVAQALVEPGAQTSRATLEDSDDEDECQDELVARKRAAAQKIAENSCHVYLLLKAYVRAAAAHCGLREYRKAYDYMIMAMRITPYDDDLREDVNKILEKLKFNTLVSASTGRKTVDFGERKSEGKIDRGQGVAGKEETNQSDQINDDDNTLLEQNCGVVKAAA